MRIAEAASSVLNAVNHRIKFSVHENSGQVVIKIVERESDEVIRQIPPEEIIKLMDDLEEMQGHIVQAEA